MDEKPNMLDFILIAVVLSIAAFVVLAIDHDDKCRDNMREPVGFFQCD